MADKDIRWIQRFSNYKKALARLGNAVELMQERELSDLEEQGLIQGFEFTFDMAWKTLRDFVVERGYEGEREKPVPVIAETAGRGIINEKSWRLMYQSRNKTSHSYDEAIADEVVRNIVAAYYNLFIQLETRLQVEKLQQEKE